MNTSGVATATFAEAVTLQDTDPAAWALESGGFSPNNVTVSQLDATTIELDTDLLVSSGESYTLDYLGDPQTVTADASGEPIAPAQDTGTVQS